MTNDFIYTTYIKSTPEKVWAALTNPEFTRQYWGMDNISDWKKGSEWKHTDGTTVRVIGKVLESDPPKRLLLSWAEPEDANDVSNIAYDIVVTGDLVCLTITHSDFKPGSTMKGKVSKGWPLVLSNLKSYLETGKAFDISALKSCSKSAAA